ncbi:MAG: alpha-amylase [Eubacterium sp.]|nr:alpha-amylase [Eubacterium sp.]
MNKAVRLDRFYDYISESDDSKEIYIPQVWNSFIGCLYEETNKKNVIRVNEAQYFKTVIEKIRELKDEMDTDIKHSRIYCAMPRYTMAWDTKGDGSISNGTLVRMLALLPILKKMQVNVLYLLPITEYSTRNQKGDMGSPFAIKDFYKLDPNLHDEIIDGMNEFSLDDEFHILVEAAHLIGIRIVIDFIPRVTARDSNLILEHPDWFYWIDKDYEKDFKTPEIPGLDFFEECTVDNIEKVYLAESTKKHLTHFRKTPNLLNTAKWEEVVERIHETGENALALIEKEFGITTPPAHSDWINDVQPIWTDITFWKLYMDNNPWASKYLSKDQPDYVMFDTIKTNKFPAKEPNQQLWDLFEDVLKYYATEFKLDGFRFDIGHTLPPALLQRLFATVREYVKNPIFISEDLFNRNHESARKTGYNIMLGSSWNEVSHISKETYENFILELKDMNIMAYACAETHDTPRIVTRKGGKKLSRSLAIVNNFLPNGAHFMLAGYEINESQPMNCGLADNTNGAPIKKAFFNEMIMDWDSDDAKKMIDYLINVNTIRKDLEDSIDAKDFEMMDIDNSAIGFKYGDDAMVFFNTDMDNPVNIHLPEDSLDNYKVAVSSSDSFPQNNESSEITLDGASALLLCKR